MKPGTKYDLLTSRIVPVKGSNVHAVVLCLSDVAAHADTWPCSDHVCMHVMTQHTTATLLLLCCATAADTILTSVAAALQYRTVAARGAMLFFLLNSLNKIHAFYQYSLNAFVTVFSRAIDVAPGKFIC